MLSAALSTANIPLLVSRANAVDIGHWLGNPGYNGTAATLQQELRCYALPYGAWGFGNHILTYYTVACLAYGLRPFAPWSRISEKKWDIALGALGLAFTVTVAVLTIVRCRNSWQFMLLAVWKLMLSITAAAITIHAGHISRKIRLGNLGQHYTQPEATGWTPDGQYALTESRKNLVEPNVQELRSSYNGSYHNNDENNANVTQPKVHNPYRQVLWWGFLYFPGAVTGFVGIMSLVREYFAVTPTLQTITYIFIGIASGGTLVIAVIFFFTNWDGANFFRSFFQSTWVGLVWAFVILTILSALYTDWALGAMNGDITGTPAPGNEILYYIYWAAKRLPMFSI